MIDQTLVITVAVLSLAVAFTVGFGIGYMVGHDDGWDEAANTPPRQLEMAKRLMAALRKDRA